ncbi:PIG-L family deacetylase [Streptomyces sp. NA02950]|uniref:PIG-L deacetylase family protein n=1 Tax=Streptomyces sp. NA02950 TaxID=2742137 RepID=UPI0015905297|nr:PIG-L family deacetylase [Streptomyces sp. NA02950]QKV94915.1 PIG-L family deacetylase [Streptomyces sp. NA02950]
MIPGTSCERVVALSPHFDDAVLSVGGLLGTLAGRAVVVTIHGGPPPDGPPSDWDRLCGFGSGAAAASAREEEDRVACGVIGAEARHLSYPDGAYGAPASVDELTDALEAYVTEDTLVLVPAGLCRHADHHRTRDAALGTLAALGVGQAWLYADQPYASRSGHWAGPGAKTLVDEVWRERLAPVVEDFGLPEARTLRLTAEMWAVKHRAVLAYASQLGPLATYAGHFLAFDGPLRTELIWRVGVRPMPSRRATAGITGGT